MAEVPCASKRVESNTACRAKNRPTRVRLGVEVLEDRIVPSFFPATTNGIHVFEDQLPSLSTAQVQFLATHTDGTQKQTLDQINQLRAINPDYTLLHYQLGTGNSAYDYIINNQWSSDWSYVNAQESWFAHQSYSGEPQSAGDLSSGRVLGNGDSSWNQADIANPAWQNYTLSQIFQNMAATGSNAWFADSFTYGIGGGGYNGTIPTRYQGTNAANPADWPGGITWTDQLRNWVNTIETAFALHNATYGTDYQFIPNLDARATSWEPNWYDNAGGVPVVDGAFLEGFGQYTDTYDWTLSMNRGLNLTDNGKIVIMQPYFSDTPDSAAGQQERNFYLGTYLLLKGDETYLNMFYGGGAQYFPEYQLNLGTATTPLANDVSSYLWNGVYRRDFQNGFVLVNPGSTAYTLNLGANFQQVQGHGGGTLTDSQLDANGNYIGGSLTYQNVSSVNLAGGSAAIFLNEASPPVAPTNLSPVAGNAQVSLTWTASAGAASYDVYRGTSSNGEGAVPIATGITTTSFTNTGLSNGTTYYYEVSAVNAGGQSGTSNQVSATPQVAAPAAPSNLVATAGNAQIALSWTASSGAASYDLYRGTSSGGETLVDSGITATNFTDTGLTNGTTYYYEVSAVNAGGQSGKSNQVSATPQVAAPTAPTNLVATAGNAQVALSWTASSGASTYDLYRGTSSGGETLIKSGLTGVTYTDTGLTNGTTYYYEVSAVNAGGQSGTSNQVSATPQVAAPAAPTNLVATAGNAQVALSWTASSGASTYDLYRGTSSGGETLIKSGITGVTYTDTGLSNGTTYYYEVSAVNAGGQSGTSNQVSAMPSASIVLTPGTLPGGIVGGPYSQQINAAGGSGIGFTYQVTAGLLPPGLTLNLGSGLLSGTPASMVGNPFAFRVTATDSLGHTGIQSYTLNITSPLGTSPNAIYVENLYGLLLHRAADLGAAGWVAALNQGVAPSTVILGLESSQEYLSIVVSGIYEHYLNRVPDPAGLSYWVSVLQSGETIEQVIEGFIASPEFYQVQGGGTNAGFVTVFYQDILNRKPDLAGYNYWLNALNTGTIAPAAMAWGFLRSLEYDGDLVSSDYQLYLRRTIDGAGFNYWTGQMQEGLTDQAVLAALLGSAEGFADWS